MGEKMTPALDDKLRCLQSLLQQMGASVACKTVGEARDALLTAHLTQPAQAVDVEDAERWRYLVSENNRGAFGAFRICWFDERGDLFTTDCVSIDGKDEQAIVRIIDKARLTAALAKFAHPHPTHQETK